MAGGVRPGSIKDILRWFKAKQFNSGQNNGTPGKYNKKNGCKK